MERKWESQKSVKMAEIEKSKIEVLIKVGYNLSDLKVSDLNSEVFSLWLGCYVYRSEYSIYGYRSFGARSNLR